MNGLSFAETPLREWKHNRLEAAAIRSPSILLGGVLFSFGSLDLDRNLALLPWLWGNQGLLLMAASLVSPVCAMPVWKLVEIASS